MQKTDNKPKRGRPPAVDFEVEDEIRKQVLQHPKLSGEALLDRLQKTFPDRAPVDVRTVRRRMKLYRPAERINSAPWDPTELDLNDAIFVFQCLGAALDGTLDNAWRLTKSDARAIAMVGRVAPGLTPGEAFELGRNWGLRVDNGYSTDVLALSLALRPWQTLEAFQRFTQVRHHLLQVRDSGYREIDGDVYWLLFTLPAFCTRRIVAEFPDYADQEARIYFSLSALSYDPAFSANEPVVPFAQTVRENIARAKRQFEASSLGKSDALPTKTKTNDKPLSIQRRHRSNDGNQGSDDGTRS